MEKTLPVMIYLDHAATSWPKPEEVSRESLRVLTGLTANAGRSGYEASVASARMVSQVRQRLAELLGVGHPENLVFVRGCTEGLNLVLKGFLKPGQHVAVSPLEHNALWRPLSRLQRQLPLHVQTLPADPLGRIDLEAARRVAAARRFDLVAVAHASNVNGVVQDLAGLRQVFADTPLLVDAAQTAGVLPISIESAKIDFLTCSVHKGLLGPTGLGVCYLAPQHDVAPLIEGSTGSFSDSLEQPAFRPDRYEAGTLNLHGIAGTYGALLGVKQRGLLGSETRRLTRRLVEGLQAMGGVSVYSPADGTALCTSFNVDGLLPDEVATRLEQNNAVSCRPGLQCAPAAHRHLQTFPLGTIRFSPGWGTTEEMVDVALRGVAEIAHSVV
jgi:selenocysteine lyase/cysteine desulfurase